MDTFYEIIKEAKDGRVECVEYYNLAFNTIIVEDGIDYRYTKRDDIYVPTLIIKNKKEFESLLNEYTELAYEFYGLDNEFKGMDEKYRVYYIKKTLMTFLWTNATLEDFNNPNEYIKTRINFLKNEMLPTYEDINLGRSELLKSDIIVENRKSSFYSEAPYALRITLNNGDEAYELPRIYYGIDKDEAYIYAIQNPKNANEEHNQFQKFIKRALYKLNIGLDENDNFENYDIGNLKDITPSFLLAANIIFSLFESKNIKKVTVPTILLVRYNAKELAIDKRKNVLLNETDDEEKIKEINDIIDDAKKKHLVLQSNMTEKLIRTFLRLSHHCDGIGIHCIPNEINTSLELNIGETTYINNPILEETHNLAMGKNKFLN